MAKRKPVTQADIKRININIARLRKAVAFEMNEFSDRVTRIGERVTRIDSLIFNEVFKKKGKKEYNELVKKWSRPRPVRSR